MAVYTKLSEEKLNDFFLKYNLGKLIKNSLDNKKLENLYDKSLQEAKISFKKTRV